MDVSGRFFNRLRTLAVTVEKETEQLKQIFQSDDSEESEEDSPIRYLHELFSEVRTLKSDADNTLYKSSSERDATYDFTKATKVLMEKTSTDLGKIRDFFQKYGYKPIAGKDAATQDEAETKPECVSAEEEPEILDCPEPSSTHHSLLQIPQLSDFGLSKYALPSTSGIVHIQLTHAQKVEPRVDDSECVSPKAEQFHIHGYKMSVNDDTTSLMVDQTIFLLNTKNSRQANNKPSESEVELESVKNLATPRQNKFCDDDYMASPAAPQFCTPGLKIPHRTDTLPKSSEIKELDASNHTSETSLPDTQSLITKPKQTCIPNNEVLGYGTVAPVPHLDKYLDCLEPFSVLDGLEEPPPPAISDYSNLFSSPPPPPEITTIPKQISQILSKYNPKVESSRSLEKGTHEGIDTLIERQPVLGIGNKENRK